MSIKQMNKLIDNGKSATEAQDIVNARRWIFHAAVERGDIFVNVSEVEINNKTDDEVLIAAPAMAYFDDLGPGEDGWKSGTLFADVDPRKDVVVDYYCNWD